MAIKSASIPWGVCTGSSLRLYLIPVKMATNIKTNPINAGKDLSKEGPLFNAKDTGINTVEISVDVNKKTENRATYHMTIPYTIPYTIPEHLPKYFISYCRDNCTSMFSTPLFIIARKWISLCVHQLINRKWRCSMCTMEFYCHKEKLNNKIEENWCNSKITSGVTQTQRDK